MNVKRVVQRCENHIPQLKKSQIEVHYKAVVRALVTEAVDLSLFLQKVAGGTKNLQLGNSSATTSELDQLKFTDWAFYWVQVIAELRLGVKLRKVHSNRAPIEYELTPYEILMKDIRTQRLNLRKILINGDIPQRVTKDAHALILEFIRSRPPLKKVNALLAFGYCSSNGKGNFLQALERKLPPRTIVLTPREQLMNSIKKGHALRPTRNSTSPAVVLGSLTNDDYMDVDDVPQTARKLIKVGTN